MTAERNVRLISVNGDDPEEYADLIGTEGTLGPAGADSRTKDGLTFMPRGRGDWLVIDKESEATANGRVTVHSKLGNTFIFRLL